MFIRMNVCTHINTWVCTVLKKHRGSMCPTPVSLPACPTADRAARRPGNRRHLPNSWSAAGFVQPSEHSSSPIPSAWWPLHHPVYTLHNAKWSIRTLASLPSSSLPRDRIVCRETWICVCHLSFARGSLLSWHEVGWLLTCVDIEQRWMYAWKLRATLMK